MFEGNPIYNSVPTTAPGLEGLRYMLGDAWASLTGGLANPYVPVNQSTFDATLSKHVNGPLYHTMMANMYRQMGYQLGNTVGAMGMAKQFGAMAGLSPEELRRALSGGGAAFGRSFAGQMVMPMLDAALAGAGISGGSMVAAANAVYSQRLHLLSPGIAMDPLNAGQQHQAMGAASAVASMLNGMMSQTTADGHLSLLANSAVTQGFDRQRIAQLAMRAAGMGAFTSYANASLAGGPGVTAGGLGRRLMEASGGVDLAMLDYTAGDFTGGGKDSVLGHDQAQKVKTLTREFTHRMQGITEAMAAMRDLTHEVEGLEDKLSALTNGDWLRSGTGGFAARDAVRTLRAVTAMHDISPTAAIGQLVANRSVLQGAAGFDPSMQALGFNGGGMFGLPAQTELLSSIEEMITARGVRGDPVLANRLRQQGVQAMARNMNTVAGRGAQILAYARQTGIISNEEARSYQDLLASGDRGVMGSTLNRLLVTVFGSAEAGRRFMNDQMQMNTMQQAMNDEAGVFAMQTTIRGADAEFGQRGLAMAAERRLTFTKQLMSEAGMRTWQSDADVQRLTESVARSIQEATAGPGGQPSAEGQRDAAAFKAQVSARIAQGMSPLAAFTATKDAFARNTLTSSYSEVIDVATKRQAAVNNEATLARGGRESYQANVTMQALQRAGLMQGQAGVEIATMIREGRGGEALARVRGLVGGLDASNRSLFGDTLDAAGRYYDTMKETLQDNAAAEVAIAKAHAGQYSADDAAQAYRDVVEAARAYARNKDTAQGYDDFMERYSHSKFSLIFGEDEQKAVLDAVAAGNMGFFRTMGRQAGAIQRAAVANRQDSGHGAHMAGYWGGGAYAGNSKMAMERRNALIKKIADADTEDSLLSAADRDTLGHDAVALFLGEKDWQGLLKQYDPEGKMASRLKKFGAAYSRYESATWASNDLLESYNTAYKNIAKNHGGAVAAHLTKLLQGGIQEEGNVASVAEFLSANGISGKDSDAVLAYTRSLLDLYGAHTATESALSADIKSDTNGFGDDFKVFSKRVQSGSSRASRLLMDKDLQAFISGLALDDASLDEATGKTKKAFDKLWETVSDEEVAAARGLKSSKGLTKEEWTQTALKIVNNKAALNNQDAVDTLSMFKAASGEGVMRVRGEVSIRSGNEQYPAVLDGSIGRFCL